jgi:hypothetical protein
LLRDLFEADNGGWPQDVAPLDWLVAEKLLAEVKRTDAGGCSVSWSQGTRMIGTYDIHVATGQSRVLLN